VAGQGDGSEQGKEVLRLIWHVSAPESSRSVARAIVATVMTRRFISCSSIRSPAFMEEAPVEGAYMVGTRLGEPLVTVRQVQWAAVRKCYAASGICAHLGALVLRLLGTATTNRDRSFTHSLRPACPSAAPASPGDGRPPDGRYRPFVTPRKSSR
jgi:hypothetical protein